MIQILPEPLGYFHVALARGLILEGVSKLWIRILTATNFGGFSWSQRFRGAGTSTWTQFVSKPGTLVLMLLQASALGAIVSV